MKTARKTALVFAALLALAAPAAADVLPVTLPGGTTYYVDTDGQVWRESNTLSGLQKVETWVDENGSGVADAGDSWIPADAAVLLLR